MDDNYSSRFYQPLRSLQNPYNGTPGAQADLTPQETAILSNVSSEAVKVFFSGYDFEKRAGSKTSKIALVAEMPLGAYPEDIMQSWGKICSTMKKEGVDAKMTTTNGQAYFIVPLEQESALKALLSNTR